MPSEAPAVAPAATARHPHAPMPPSEPSPVPRRVEFQPRRGLQNLLGLLVSLSLLSALATCWVAYESRENRDIVLAGIMAALAFVLASIRATINPVHLLIDSGQLHISRGHLQEVHDLTSQYTDVRVEGDPSSRSWAVVISRYDAPTTRITHDQVDGRAFVPVVRYWRGD